MNANITKYKILIINKKHVLILKRTISNAEVIHKNIETQEGDNILNKNIFIEKFKRKKK